MTKSQYLLIVSFSFSCLTQFSIPATGAETDYLKAAINEYYKGHYTLARAQLEESIKKNPKNQLAHYFLAQTLAEIHDYKGATTEYITCHKLDPDSTCGIKAKQGFEQLHNFEQLNLQKGYDSIRQERRASAKDRITTQIDKKVEESVESNKAIAKKTMEDAQKEVSRIQAQSQQDIDSLPRLRRNGYWRNQMTQQIREQAKERIKSVMDKAKSQTEQMEKDTASRIDSLENMKQGIHQNFKKTSTKGTNLAPEGTNVYIRNYEHKK